MPEPKDPHVQDLRAKAVAEGVFRLVEELTKKIAKDRQAVSREGLVKQSAAHLYKVRKYVVGSDKKRLSPEVAHRLAGEYLMRASQLEEALLAAEVEEAPVTGGLATLKEAFMPIPRNKLVEFQPAVTRRLAKLQAVDEQRGAKTDPAWTAFMYEASMKHMSIPNFKADEWYGEAMSQRSPLMRKLVLPLVAYDACERAAQEGSKPMPNKERFMDERHRVMNALDELIELWEAELPAVADKYTAVKAALDHELMTLSLYHRYKTRE